MDTKTKNYLSSIADKSIGFEINKDTNNYYYQDYAINYSVDRLKKEKGVIICYGLGTGKTRICYSIVKKLSDMVSGLISFSPLSLLQTHKNYFSNFNIKLDNEPDFKPIGSNKIYTYLSDYKSSINSSNRSKKPILVIIDEAHLLSARISNKQVFYEFNKSRNKIPSFETTEIYKIYTELMKGNYKIIMLTGTPIENDIYNCSPLFNLTSGYFQSNQTLLPDKFSEFMLIYGPSYFNPTTVSFKSFVSRIKNSILWFDIPYGLNIPMPDIIEDNYYFCPMKDIQLQYYIKFDIIEKRLSLANSKSQQNLPEFVKDVNSFYHYRSFTRSLSNGTFPSSYEEKLKTFFSDNPEYTEIKKTDEKINLMDKNYLLNLHKYSAKSNTLLYNIDLYKDQFHGIYSNFVDNSCGLKYIAKLLELKFNAVSFFDIYDIYIKKFNKKSNIEYTINDNEYNEDNGVNEDNGINEDNIVNEVNNIKGGGNKNIKDDLNFMLSCIYKFYNDIPIDSIDIDKFTKLYNKIDKKYKLILDLLNPSNNFYKSIEEIKSIDNHIQLIKDFYKLFNFKNNEIDKILSYKSFNESNKQIIKLFSYRDIYNNHPIVLEQFKKFINNIYLYSKKNNKDINDTIDFIITNIFIDYFNYSKSKIIKNLNDSLIENIKEDLNIFYTNNKSVGDIINYINNIGDKDLISELLKDFIIKVLTDKDNINNDNSDNEDNDNSDDIEDNIEVNEDNLINNLLYSLPSTDKFIGQNLFDIQNFGTSDDLDDLIVENNNQEINYITGGSGIKKNLDYIEFKKIADKYFPNRPIYIFISGNIKEEFRNIQEFIFNNKHNTKDKLIKYILFSPAAAHGLSFASVQNIHVYDYSYTPSEIIQAVARFRRINSAKYLPEKERYLRIFRYIASKDSFNLNLSDTLKIANFKELDIKNNRDESSKILIMPNTKNREIIDSLLNIIKENDNTTDIKLLVTYINKSYLLNKYYFGMKMASGNCMDFFNSEVKRDKQLEKENKNFPSRNFVYCACHEDIEDINRNDIKFITFFYNKNIKPFKWLVSDNKGERIFNEETMSYWTILPELKYSNKKVIYIPDIN